MTLLINLRPILKEPLSEHSQGELEARLLYAVIVAGKSADFADKACARLWEHCREGETPFAMLRRIDYAQGVLRSGSLEGVLRECRVGNYGKISRCFRELAKADIDLRTCSPEALERFHGIGPKTSRFFVMWTRPEAKHAALDVHVLRWMRAQGYAAPRTTPSGRVYAELERAFIAEAEKRGKTPRELDYEIWCAAAGRPQETSGY